MNDEKWWFSFFFLQVKNPGSPAPFIEDVVFSPHPCQISVSCIYMWLYLDDAVYSIDLYVCSVSYYVGFIIMALKYSLKSSMIIPPMAISPSVFLFVLSALAVFSLLCLQRKFEIILPVEKGCGFFLLWLQRIYILLVGVGLFSQILILATHDHGRSFQFLASSSISSFGGLFSLKRSIVSLVRIPPTVLLLLLFAWDCFGGYCEQHCFFYFFCDMFDICI